MKTGIASTNATDGEAARTHARAHNFDLRQSNCSKGGPLCPPAPRAYLRRTWQRGRRFRSLQTGRDPRGGGGLRLVVTWPGRGFWRSDVTGARLGDGQLVEVLQRLSHLLWADVVNGMSRSLEHKRTKKKKKNYLNCSLKRSEATSQIENLLIPAEASPRCAETSNRLHCWPAARGSSERKQHVLHSSARFGAQINDILSECGGFEFRRVAWWLWEMNESGQSDVRKATVGERATGCF